MVAAHVLYLWCRDMSTAPPQCEYGGQLVHLWRLELGVSGLLGLLLCHHDWLVKRWMALDVGRSSLNTVP